MVASNTRVAPVNFNPAAATGQMDHIAIEYEHRDRRLVHELPPQLFAFTQSVRGFFMLLQQQLVLLSNFFLKRTLLDGVRAQDIQRFVHVAEFGFLVRIGGSDVEVSDRKPRNLSDGIRKRAADRAADDHAGKTNGKHRESKQLRHRLKATQKDYIDIFDVSANAGDDI